MAEAGSLKVNGQFKTFGGYGGIEEPDTYIKIEYGSDWCTRLNKTITGLPGFKQNIFGHDNDNNCTLASITRVMKYYSDRGYHGIPADIHEIYSRVREIGVKHGYDPKKSGIIRDLFVYTPFEINDMARETWNIFYNSAIDSKNKYLGKIKIIVENTDSNHPVLLNIAAGDYKGHTVTVTGYRIYSREGQRDLILVQIFDGWSEAVRYIDWKKFGNTLANVTTIVPG